MDAEATKMLLGAQLRALRIDARLTLKEVAPVIRASVSKISRLERGDCAASARDVLDLLRYYEMKNPAASRARRAINDLLAQGKEPAWWQEYGDVTPEWLRRLISMEDSATEIWNYEMMMVPGLLQTPAYSRALVLSAIPRATEEEIERRLAVRHIRQQNLRKEGAPELRAYLDEGVLRRPRGGLEVMIEQLQHLKRMGRRRNVSIRVVRYARSVHIAPPSPITCLKAPGWPTRELIYLEQANSATYLSNRAQVEVYKNIIDEIAYAAESRTATLQFLDQLIEEFKAAL